MAKLIFWDVDTQYDFMYSDGKLYVTDAELVLPNLARLTRHARKAGIPQVASIDYHALTDAELSSSPDFDSTFPPHCLASEPGHEKVDATRAVNPLYVDSAPDPATIDRVRGHKGEVVIRKQRFDVFTNPNTEAVLTALAPTDVAVYGVAQDVCDRFAIEGLLARGYRVHVVRDAMKPIRPEKGEQLLADWFARGADVVTTEDVLANRLHLAR